MKRAWLVAFAFCACTAIAQDRPNAALLIAKPDMEDPNFARSVVLVTQADSGETVGVTLNRPSNRKHPRTGEVLYSGGPVMREVLVAVFRSADVPTAPAFHVLRGVYLSMHPSILDGLLTGERKNHRLYAGFSGWAPGQLESEMQRDAWYVLPATEALLFRDDTSGMWEELVERARGGRTGLDAMARADQSAGSRDERIDSRIIPHTAMSKSPRAGSRPESKGVY